MITRTALAGGSRSAVAVSFSPRNIARTMTAVIESGSGVTSVRPFRSCMDLSGVAPGISTDAVYSVKPCVQATAL